MELSIVLVILGLLVGGILGGQALINAAAQRSILVDRDRYITALHSFKLRYNALPGDISNASRFFPSCTTFGSAYNETRCNGDGNRYIVLGDGGTAPYYTEYEGPRAFHHMALAGIINVGNAGYDLTPPTTLYTYRGTRSDVMEGWVPQSRYGNGYFNLGGYDFTEGGVTRYLPALILTGGTAQGNQVIRLMSGIMTPAELYLLDMKADDGMPLTGSLRAMAWNAGAATCHDSAEADAYRMSAASGSNAICTIAFLF